MQSTAFVACTFQANSLAKRLGARIIRPGLAELFIVYVASGSRSKGLNHGSLERWSLWQGPPSHTSFLFIPVHTRYLLLDNLSLSGSLLLFLCTLYQLQRLAMKYPIIGYFISLFRLLKTKEFLCISTKDNYLAYLR